MSQSVKPPRLLLASSSPRRKQLLETLGLNFAVSPGDSEEEHPDAHRVDSVTQANARRKAHAVGSQVGTDDVVVAADTLVVCGDEVIGKPTDIESARAMLRTLSGRPHIVVTGIALVSPRWGEKTACDRSSVTFRRLSEDEINDYLSTREPYDKAGSYAVQGLGCLFIDRIDGSYTNVMGLPIELLLRELASFTGIPTHQWFP